MYVDDHIPWPFSQMHSPLLPFHHLTVQGGKPIKAWTVFPKDVCISSALYEQI